MMRQGAPTGRVAAVLALLAATLVTTPGVKAAGDGTQDAPAALIERYVRGSDGVRKARADLEAAEDAYEKEAGIARRPRVAVASTPLAYGVPSPAAGGSVRPDPGEPVWSSRTELDLTWSPLPALNFGASGSVEKDVTSGDWARSVGLNGTLALWPWPGPDLDAQDALAKLEQAQRALVQAEAQARIDGQLLYVRLRVARARVELARQEAQSRASVLQQAIAKQASGLASAADVAQAQIQAQSALASLQEAVAQAASLEGSLVPMEGEVAVLPLDDALIEMARSIVDAARSASSLWPLQEADQWGLVAGVRELPASLRQQAVETDPSVVGAARRLDLARQRLDAVGKGWGDASVRADVSSTAGRDGETWETRWSVGLSLSTDILDGGARSLERRQAERAVETAAQDLERARQDAGQAADSAWRTLSAAALRMEASRMELEQAYLSYRAAVERRAKGVSGDSDVEQARRAAWSSALDLAEAAASVRAQQQRLAWQAGLSIEEVAR